MNYVCKFCGCDQQRACSIPFRVDDADDEEDRGYIETGPIEQLAVDIDYQPCVWLLVESDNCVCSAPACVEKAYVEARPLAE